MYIKGTSVKKAVVVVDMQNDFIDGSLGTREAQEMLPRLKDKLQKLALSDEMELIFTMDTHEENYLSTQEGKNLPVEHCIKDTHGWLISRNRPKLWWKNRHLVQWN